MREPDHFNELTARYTELLHRLHPERASEQGLRAYDAVAAPTSAAEVQRTVMSAENNVLRA